MKRQIQTAKRVLVVDDDPISRKLTAHIFSAAGCLVKTAQDGIEALSMVKDFVPDVMIIDLIMPYLKGDRLCQIIREIEPLQKPTLAILSGVAVEAALEPSEFGADACIAKGDPDYHLALLDLLHRDNGSGTPSDGWVSSRRTRLSKRTTTKELLAVQRRLEFILQNMVEPLFEIDHNGRIVFANQSAVALAGDSEFQLLGSNFLELFSPASAGRIRMALEGVKASPVEIREDEPALVHDRVVAGWLMPFTVDEHHTVVAMLRDITARQKAEKALERSRASFHDIVEKNVDGILVLDARNHMVLYANQRAAAFLEQPVQQLVGNPFAPAATTDFPMEIDIFRPDIGEHGIAEMRIVSTQWANRPARLVTLTDITQRTQLEQGLKTAKVVAEQASRAKSDFLANMSHELRSPLNALLLLAQNLENNKDGNLTPDQIESVQLIYKSGSILLQLISDILDFSKIEAGRMDVYAAGAKLAELVDRIRALYRHVAQSKGLALEFVVDDALPETIFTDCQKLEQIIRNLIANAIKFTPDGSITVEFLRPSSDPLLPSWLDPATAIAIAVSDTGTGISDSHRDQIFEAFIQADGSISRKYGGTGLGLSISRKLAKLLGGDICLASTNAKGSRFVIYLPENLNDSANQQKRYPPKNRIEDADDAVAAASGENATQEPDEAYKMLAGRKVLVVDDKVRHLFSITKVLEGYGLRVRKAINGQKALALLEKEPGIDIVLMDIAISGKDGCEIIRRIRSFELFEKLPIIVLSGIVAQGGRAECLSAGADDYLPKPVAARQLLDAMKRLVT